jgi:CRP/FNR family transcriptional regulator, cyclic AMP receptor protein
MTSLSEHSRHQQALDYLLKYCHVKSYPAKTVILSAGKPNTKLYMILEGSVSISTEEEDGRELVYTYLNKGDFIGEVGFFTRTEDSTFDSASLDAVATENSKFISVIIKTRTSCRLAEISHSRLQWLLKYQSPEYAADILFLIGKQIANRLLAASRNYRDLAFLDTEGRIARTLLDLCQEPDAKSHIKGMEIKITRQELSRLVGCSREVAGRVLKELEKKNVIATSGKSIVVYHSVLTEEQKQHPDL